MKKAHIEGRDCYEIEEIHFDNNGTKATITSYFTVQCPKKMSDDRYYVYDTEEQAQEGIMGISYPTTLKILKRVIRKVARKYGAFPSSTHPSKNFIFILDYGNFRGWASNSKDYSTITVCLDIKHARPHPAYEAITHELLHIVSSFHHLESDMDKYLQRYRKNLQLPIEKNQKEVELALEEFSKTVFNPQFKDIDFNYQLNAFFGDWVNSFWNKVLDSALCTIAIELSDWKFIDINCENDGSQLIHLKHNLSVLKGEYDAFSKSKNEKNLSFIRLLQFINCFAYFPFMSLSYALLGRNGFPKKSWHLPNKANHVINKFVSIVEEFSDPDVFRSFMVFFESYKEILRKGAIHIDPTNRDLTQQIHNSNTIKHASETYKTLNREFAFWLNEYRKHN